MIQVSEAEFKRRFEDFFEMARDGEVIIINLDDGKVLSLGHCPDSEVSSSSPPPSAQ